MSSSKGNRTLLALRNANSDSDATSSSSSSSSSSASSDDDDDDTAVDNDCRDLHAEALADLYTSILTSQAASAQGTKKTRSPGLSRRSSDRLRIAILNARIALFRRRWNDLLGAFKALDMALKGASDAPALGFRVPILARLTTDVILACRIASSSKRTLSSQDAKALTMLRQKLPKEASGSQWTAEMARRPPGPFSPIALTAADEAVMHGAELLLLVGGCGTLCLAHLQALDHVPESLRQLPALLDWFSAFGGTGPQRPLFTSLDVSHTPLRELPPWLPDILPDLTSLDLRATLVATLPSTLPLFRKMQTLHAPATTTTTNALLLVEKASTLLRAGGWASSSTCPSRPPRVLPLTLLCLRVLASRGYEGLESLPGHLRDDPYEGSYVCAGCARAILVKDHQWLHAPLAERIFLFNPPLGSSSNEDEQDIVKTSVIIGGPEWRFCASCLFRHCTEGKCGCLVCKEEKRVMTEERSVRWARRRV